MTKQAFNLPGAPSRPYSAAIRAGDFIFISGTGGNVNPETGESIAGIAAQTRQCLENIKRVLDVLGASFDDVVKCTVFISDAKDFAAMNQVYRSYFGKDLPARSTVVTGLVRPEMLIELECIAYCPR